MKRHLTARRLAWFVLVVAIVLVAGAALARPGGGGAFSGGSGGGGGGWSGGSGSGGGGGGGGDLIGGVVVELAWYLLALAFTHPVYGMPILAVPVLLVVLYTFVHGLKSSRPAALGLLAVFVCFATLAFNTVAGLVLVVALLLYVRWRGAHEPPGGWVAEEERAPDDPSDGMRWTKPAPPRSTTLQVATISLAFDAAVGSALRDELAGAADTAPWGAAALEGRLRDAFVQLDRMGGGLRAARAEYASCASPDDARRAVAARVAVERGRRGAGGPRDDAAGGFAVVSFVVAWEGSADDFLPLSSRDDLAHVARRLASDAPPIYAVEVTWAPAEGDRALSWPDVEAMFPEHVRVDEAAAPDASPAPQPEGVRAMLERVRDLDPDFSVVLFEDFLYALYAAVHRARGDHTLDDMAGYLTAPVRAKLREASVARVCDVVIGAMRVVRVRGLDAGEVRVDVEFEANYTEVAEGGDARGLYVLERWRLMRGRTARSKPPERARVLGCPACGGELKTDVGGACAYCKQVVEAGAFDWTVEGVDVLRREARAPVLTAQVEERGNERATLVDPEAAPRLRALAERDPAFDRAAFGKRVELIFGELQVAWSSRAWERARPYVSDNLFQSQQYWMEAYARARLRNVTLGSRVTGVEDARVTADRWYDAITVRVRASGPDFTVADDGTLVCGDRDRERPYSEYWTLIRGAGCRGPARTDPVCPKCGADLKINMAGDCEYCHASVTAGAFDWVLSRIEQDETYQR